ncbi:MAG: tRNA pseudouridine(38-40) synthase TruA [Gammaproteobacteria bacterium]|nr:tRNA pseudouridine(38-40) synthase TruA [Gammaproteobacteria bacterium]
MRIALGVEYDGTGYCGWQLQQGALTVQAVVEAALAQVAAHPVRVSCAGRTDTGVHAEGQVVHFDSDAVRTERSWVFGANANLPKDVVITWARPVDNRFHARFSATGRAYRYLIYSRAVRPTFLAGRVTWSHTPLQLQPMREAAQLLLGRHDFTTFRAVACQAKSPVREIRRLDMMQQGAFTVIEVEADGFLHHMVRNIAGVLMKIGRGEAAPTWCGEILAARDRREGGITAPPSGLYLTRVDYPEAFALPNVKQQTATILSSLAIPSPISETLADANSP